MGRGVDHISRPTSDYYARVYLDLVSPSMEAVRFACDFAGFDRLIFGSDHPWVDIGIFTRLIDELEITDGDREKIYSGNARRLFRI